MTIAGYNKNVLSFAVNTNSGSVGTYYVATAPPGGMRLHGASIAVERTIVGASGNYLAASLINGASVGESTDLMGAFGGANVSTSALRPYALNLGDHASEIAGGSVLLFKYHLQGADAASHVSLSIDWTQGGDQA